MLLGMLIFGKLALAQKNMGYLKVDADPGRTGVFCYHFTVPLR